MTNDLLNTQAINTFHFVNMLYSLYQSYVFICLQANWFKASQYCRFHGMHLASIASQEENDRLEKHIRDFGKLSQFGKSFF